MIRLGPSLNARCHHGFFPELILETLWLLNKTFCPIMEGVFKERWLKFVRCKNTQDTDHFEMPNPDLMYSYTT